MFPINGIEHCLKCNACYASCPVAKANPSYPGPKVLGPDLARILESGETVPGAEWCTNCHRCEIACPHGVDTVSMIRALKNEALHQKKHYRRDLIFGYPHILGELSTPFSPMVNFIFSNSFGKNLFAQFLSLAPDASLPKYANRSFEKWYRGQKHSGDEKVVYFVGCSTNYNVPEVGKALVELLRLLNMDVIVPRQVCCGIPLLSNGFQERALKLMQYNLQNLLPYVEKGCKIVCSCPSCCLALKKEYSHELGSPEAKQLGEAVYDIAEILEMHDQELEQLFVPQKWRITYHQPCHSIAQGIGAPSLSLLKKIPGAEVSFVDGCCGQAGTYGFKKEKSEVSEKIGQQLIEAISSSKPDMVVTDCGSCSIQIQRLSGLRVEHPLVVLNRAAGRK